MTTNDPAGWPFDADQNHPLAARRVPVIDTYYPDYKYEVALCIAPQEPGSPWSGVEPTALEADLIVAAIEYRMEYYNAGWAAKMRQSLLDVDGTTNTVTLRKAPGGGWQFRRRTWNSGLMMVPAATDRASLPDVLDRCFRLGDNWESADYTAWKLRHADLIAAVRAEWETSR